MIADPTLPHTRDLVVIGCSAGGVDALSRILQQLPPDLGAAVLIVQHMAATNKPYLAGILNRTSQLPVGWAEQGARIERGHVLVAPPDVHLLFCDEHVQLTGGPRESHARPSIDKLFRSAAATYGTRVIGVLLTGMLDDGVAGLRAIRDAGGIVIVQDPASAAFPELPSRALAVVTADRVLPIDAIGDTIVSLVGEHVESATTPQDLAIEARIDREDVAPPERMSTLGRQTGHATTVRQLLSASADEVKSALWSAVRALNDRAATLETLAADAKHIGSGQSAEGYAHRAREAREQAELARRFMLDLGRSR